MTQFLPPNLLALFTARDPIPYLPPAGPLPHERRTTGYSGIGEYTKYFEEGPPPIPTKSETREEKKERKRKEKAERLSYKLEQEIAMWDPNANDKATLDPFKTIFVGRINYDTTENKLRREFDQYGAVRKVVLVKDKKTSRSRGYAFVEFEHERGMQDAYKNADGKKIDGRRVLVDFERGRAMKGWLPRRLGGGLGGTRRGGPEMNIKISGRDDQDRDRSRGDEGRHRDRRGGSNERVDRRPRDMDRNWEHRYPRVHRDGYDKPKEKDRDRDRKRHRDGDKEKDKDRRKRSRSKSKERKRHRSRSKEREKEKKKEKKDKERDRERKKEKKERERERIKMESGSEYPSIKVKEEPKDDYPSYDDYPIFSNYAMKDESESRNNNNHDR